MLIDVYSSSKRLSQKEEKNQDGPSVGECKILNTLWQQCFFSTNELSSYKKKTWMKLKT